MHLVWGSILWDAGLALSKFLTFQAENEQGRRFTGLRVLELGAGTGVVGLTLAKYGAKVTLTDCEPELLTLLRRNAEANGVAGSVQFHDLHWGDRSTYLTAPYDLIVAADVLYGKKDRWFMQALSAHLKAPATALVACPPREDSPLGGFFKAATDDGMLIERLEDSSGQPPSTLSGPPAVYEGSEFVPLHQERFPAAYADARTWVQIFRVTRRGAAAEKC